VQQALTDIRQVVEGVRAAPEVLRLARKHGVEMPISQQVERVIKGEINPVEAVRQLAMRPPRAEAG
jgi:glycerol-3-phosphate dehydrogenase (NAD(P)+)